jgi:pimeloyl-ACP methyl ester carboxylesterase
VTESAYVEIDGRLGFVETAGEGHPVLCVHTAGQSGVQWRRTLRELPRYGYRVIVPDLPGHGRSDEAAGGPVTDLGAYRDWLLRLAAELGADRFHVVGCSIGGKITLDLAASAPDRVTAAVAMAADARNARWSVRSLERSLDDVSSPSRADRTYYGTLAAVGAAVPPERAAEIARMHRREDPVISTSDLIAWTRHDLRDRLDAIACPLRMVAGADDFWIDVPDVEWTARRVPGCRLDVLPGVGHYPMEEIDDFTAVLAGWLADLETPRTSPCPPTWIEP